MYDSSILVMLAHHLQRSAAIKLILNQLSWLDWRSAGCTLSLACWPLTTAIIAGGPPAVCHRLLDKPISRPPAKHRRQSEGGISMPLMDDR